MREPLASLATIHYGRSPSGVLAEGGLIPVIGTGGAYAKTNQALFASGVVVARKGSLGTPHLMRSPFWPSDTTFAVVPSPGVDLEWLYFTLLNFDLTKLNEATGVPSISRDWLAKVRFERPVLPEQRYVAAVLTSLDKAIEATEALIAKHHQIKAGLMQELLTRGLLPSGQMRPPVEMAPHHYCETQVGRISRDWAVLPLEQCLESSPIELCIIHDITRAWPASSKRQ